ncbi:MAG: LacI family DNA-binding transcriptional regulator [Leeuwenhoekiella sp.]
MTHTTLKDIAGKLGVSVTTVSKALKGYSDVSARTRKKVEEAAAALNYTPNSFAVNLRTQESKTIGIIIPEVIHHFFSSVVNGIIAEAEKEGYLVIVLQSNESFDLERKQIQLLLDKRVDGILLSMANATDDFKHLHEVIERGIPLVMFDKIAKLVPCHKVIIDDRKAAYIATKHLIDQGCKRIAHFRGPNPVQNAIDRFLGYKKAIDDHGLPYDPKLIYTCKSVNFEDGITHTKALLADHKDVDGLFTGADLVAVGAIKTLNELGIKIPEQIAIVGFSNWFVSSAITPTLSTVDQPGLEMGQRAFDLMFQQLQATKKGIALKPETIILDTELIVRNSSKK